MHQVEIPKEKQEFIEILLKQNVLKFGTFVTKSGRTSPFFFNTGEVASGASVGAWARFYCKTLQEHFGDGPYNLYGPAYKGIPLVVATSMACEANESQKGTNYTFNRKEKKAHGEGGFLVGKSLQKGDSVIVLEDVLTGGTSLRETFTQLRELGIEIKGAIVGIDRMEKGLGVVSARQELQDNFKVPVHSIVSLDDVIAYLYGREVLGKVWIDESLKAAIDSYCEKYRGSNS